MWDEVESLRRGCEQDYTTQSRWATECFITCLIAVNMLRRKVGAWMKTESERNWRVSRCARCGRAVADVHQLWERESVQVEGRCEQGAKESTLRAYEVWCWSG